MWQWIKIFFPLLFTCIFSHNSYAAVKVETKGLPLEVSCLYKKTPLEDSISNDSSWVELSGKISRNLGENTYKCSLKNLSDKPLSIFLVSNLSYTGKQKLFLNSTDNIIEPYLPYKYLTGRFAFRIPLKPNQNATIYNEYTFHSGLSSRLGFLNEELFNKYFYLTAGTGITFLSAALILILIIFQAVLTVRMKSVKYYLVYMLSSIYISAYLSGQINIFYDLTGLVKHHFHFLVVTHLASISILIFSADFLNVEKLYPKISKIFKILININIAKLALLPFLHNVKAFNLLSDIMFILEILLITAISICIYKKKKEIFIGLFTLSWFFFAGGLISMILTKRLGYEDTQLPDILFLSGIVLEFYMVASAIFYKSADNRRAYAKKLKRHNKDLLEAVEKEKKIFRENEGRFLDEAKFSALGRLTGSLAHEFNNPLAIISASNSLLTRHVETISGKISELELKNIEKCTNTMDKSINRMSGTIKNLLEFTGSNSKNNSKANLKDILDEAAAFNRGYIERNSISLICDHIENVTYRGRASQEVFHLVNSIITNAAESLSGEYVSDGKEQNSDKEDKWIKISTGTGINNSFQIKIQNNGNLISEDILELIWEPFFSTKPLHQNQGLGLYTAKRIASSIGGSLEYTSKNGTCEFIVTIPKEFIKFN